LELPDDQPAVALMARGTFNVLQWTDMPHGGHFPVLEQPALLAEDTRWFFG
jgi:pimeloyl-ACP methyl ester carboxylesterase